MIKIEKTQVFGWEPAIRGMRNPKNSWDKSDSIFYKDGHLLETPIIGKNDLTLMKKLRKGGPDDRKYLRMIIVYADIVAPLYWWKEYDTYKVGTVANSCSTMHKIHSKEFTLDDFSHEHLGLLPRDTCYYNFEDSLRDTIDYLNIAREQYLKTKNKEYWWQMIQLLPTNYNQRRTIMLSYEVLNNIFRPTSREYHKLDEWNVNYKGSFCDWTKALPYSKELIIGDNENE